MMDTTNSDCTVYLVRHGETEWNRNGRWQGQQDVPLSNMGRRQAAALAHRFQTLDQKVDAFYSSDLQRAMETAEIIGRSLRIKPMAVPPLREIHLGSWEGHTVAEITRLYPEEWARLNAGEDIARGGGETYGAFQARILQWLNTAADAHPGETVLAVTHGGCIRSILLGIRGLAWGQRHQIPDIENASITIIRRSISGWSVAQDVDIRHLESLPADIPAQVTRDESKIV
jgi:broad specificity phosphatase PhoE